jgi:hypothetical protein
VSCQKRVACHGRVAKPVDCVRRRSGAPRPGGRCRKRGRIYSMVNTSKYFKVLGIRSHTIDDDGLIAVNNVHVVSP